MSGGIESEMLESPAAEMAELWVMTRPSPALSVETQCVLHV